MSGFWAHGHQLYVEALQVEFTTRIERLESSAKAAGAADERDQLTNEARALRAELKRRLESASRSFF